MSTFTPTQPQTLPDSAWVPATIEALVERRDALAGRLGDAGWSGEEAFGVITAATEAVANAVRHGSLPGAEVAVAFRVTEQSAEVAVLDRGGPGSFEGSAPAVPENAESGRGLMLMRGLADRLGICPAGAGTFVLMEFSRA